MNLQLGLFTKIRRVGFVSYKGQMSAAPTESEVSKICGMSAHLRLPRSSSAQRMAMKAQDLASFSSS